MTTTDENTVWLIAALAFCITVFGLGDKDRPVYSRAFGLAFCVALALIYGGVRYWWALLR